MTIAARQRTRFSVLRLMLAGEALLWLGLAWAAVMAMPLRRVVALAGLVPTNPANVAAVSRRSAAHIAWAISAADHRTPWASTCLVRAIAAAMMLRVRRRSALLVLGVNRDVATKGLAAHAWLSSDGDVLTGGIEAPLYQPVAGFERVAGR